MSSNPPSERTLMLGLLMPLAIYDSPTGLASLETRRDVVEPSTAESPAGQTDELALRAYEECHDSVWRTPRRLGVPAPCVEDAVQDVFITVHRRAGEFEGRSRLKTWVLGIAVRVAANTRRGAQRDQRRWVELPAEPVDDSSHLVLPEALAVRRQAVELLHSLLARLSSEHRDLLVLVDMEQLSVAEAADILRVNPSTCYKRLNAARERLNELVARERAQDEWRLR